MFLITSIYLFSSVPGAIAVEANSTACGDVNGDITLAANITSTGTCFTINASNVVLDGAGFTIAGNASGQGINITNFHNVTVKNFAGINNFTNGVYASGSENSTIFNNSIETVGLNGYGIHLLSGSNLTNISSNTISTSGIGGTGIRFESSSSSNTISSNTITTSGSSGAQGIRFTTSSSSNTIDSNTIIISGSGEGIRFQSSSNSNTISSNTITTSSSVGIFLNGADSNTFTNDQINTSNAAKISIDSIADNNKFTNVILNGTINFTSHSLLDIRIDINASGLPVDPSGKQNLPQYLEFTSTSVASFIDFNITYLDADVLSNMNESTIQIYRYNTSSSAWEALSTSTVDTANNVVSSGNISTFSTFAPFGDVGCGTLNADFTLTATITATGTCFTVNSSHIVLDGAGFTITGNTSDYGVNITAFHNVTVKNFAGINNFTNALYLSESVNSTIYNNTIDAANVTNGRGIRLSGSNSTNISSNTITTSGSGGDGIRLESSDSNNISSNVVNTSGSIAMGIRLSSSSSSTLSSNTITTSGSDSSGILFTDSANSNIFSSNRVSTSASNAEGVLFTLSSNSNTLSSNTITTSGSDDAGGIDLSFSNNNAFTDDRINTSNDVKITMDSLSNNNIFTNVILNGTVNFTSHSLFDIDIGIKLSGLATDPSGKKNLSRYLEFTSTSTASFIDFNITYLDSDVPSGMNESTIRIYRYNTTSSAWEVVSTSTVDAVSNIVSSGNISTFSIFGVFGNKDTPNVTINTPVANANISGSQILNATVADSDGSDTVRFNVSNSTGQQILLNATNPLGNFWNATLNTTTLADGRYNVTVIANDTLNNINNTEFVTVTVDNTAPNVTLETANGTSTTDTTPTITFNYTDALSKTASCTLYGSGTAFGTDSSVANATSASITFNASLSIATHTYNINCTDASGKVGASATNSITITSSSSSDGGSGSSSGGGSGGGGPLGAKGGVTRGVEGQFSQGVWESINAGETVVYQIEDNELGVSELQFKVKNTVRGVALTVRKRDLPQKDSSFERNSYRTLEIKVWNLGEADLDGEVKIRFEVTREWLEDSGLEAADMALFRYVNGEWTELPTAVDEEAEHKVHYTAETPGFSFFVIGGKAEKVPAKEYPAEEGV